MSRIRVERITDKQGTGAPLFPNGISVVGLTSLSNVVAGITTVSDLTATGNVSIGGTLTYEDVTNVDSIGVITARSGLKVTAGGANIVGVVTAISGVVDSTLTSGRILIAGASGRLTDNNNLTFDGTKLNITTGGAGFRITRNSQYIELDGNTGNGGDQALATSSFFRIQTGGVGNSYERLRIGTAGQIGIAGANYGTSGQVLTSQGSGSAVQWADAGGAMDIIKSVDLGTDYGQNYVDFTGITTSSGYLRYQLVFSNVQLVDNSAEVFAVRFYRGSTGALGTGSYYYYNTKKSSIGSNSITQEGTTSDAWKLLGTSNNDRANWSGKVEWAHTTDPANKLWPPVARMLVDNGEMWYSIGYDACKLTNTNSEWISGIRFMNYGSGDNLSDGRITLYGLKFS